MAEVTCRAANVAELDYWVLRALLCFLDVLPIAICMKCHVSMQHEAFLLFSTSLTLTTCHQGCNKAYPYLSNLVKPKQAHNLYANSSNLHVKCIMSRNYG